MIPKVIHYCWFGGKPLPNEVKSCIASWEKYCPDYKIEQWNENNFDISRYPFTKQAYKDKMWAFVSDYARLKVIYENGGFYFDTDVELLKNINFLCSESCYVGCQQFKGYINTGLGFGAEKGHSMVLAMMKEYDDLNFCSEEKGKISCPVLNTRAFAKKGYQQKNEIVEIEGAKIYPPTYFDPYPSGKGKNLLSAKTVSIHHYSATWTTGKQRLKRKIVRLLGEDKILAIKKVLGK